MNIKEAEQITGISRQNIRFYEKEGLVHPDRNRGNGYREYSEQDIRCLKLIAMLRKLDTPLPQIRQILEEQVPLGEAAAVQKRQLEAQKQNLEAAILICRDLEQESLENLNVDFYLDKIEKEQAGGSFFFDLLEDYKKVARSQALRSFDFLPDSSVETPREFTDELLKYAEENNLNMIITKESMYPEFEIDGHTYRAERHFSRTGMAGFSAGVAVISCTLTDPSCVEDTTVPTGKRKVMKWIHFFLPFAAFFLYLALLSQNVLFAVGVVGVICLFVLIRRIR